MQVYYFALATNLAIRFTWILYIPTSGPSLTVRAWLIAMVEIFRRWQWNFCLNIFLIACVLCADPCVTAVRLESEHLGNMDQYRIMRELPMLYPSYEAQEDG